MLTKVQENWSDILDHLRDEYDITAPSFKTFILPLEPIHFENDKLTILVPDEFVGLQYIRKKYAAPLKVSIEEILGISVELEFVLSDQFTASPSKENQKTPDVFETSGLNSKYTFSSFVVGENNNIAHSAALAVAESPGEFYNPLFIYGGAGLGKTHLMQAIAHFILTNKSDLRVLYVTCETFTNEIIEAIRSGGPSANVAFREKYRNVDVLLIDDIQFISGKETSQQELFHTFNALYENKKQIIFTSDKPPAEISNLEARLCSRFKQGLSVDIQSPNYETRVAILQKKLETEKHVTVPDDVLDYIAANVSSNIRELEGALTKILAYSKLTSTPIDLAFAIGVLQDLFDSSQKAVSPDIIIKIVAEHFNIPTSDILSTKRNSEIVYPRHLAMYLCRNLTDASLSVIAIKLGRKDHTTVMHGYEKIKNEIDINEKVKADIEILKKKIIPI